MTLSPGFVHLRNASFHKPLISLTAPMKIPLSLPSVLRASLIAALLTPGLHAQTLAPTLVSDEQVLCDFKPSHVQFSGLKGSTVERKPNAKSIDVVFPKADTGVAVRALRGSTRMNPIPYLTDVNPAIEITFRSAEGSTPENVFVVLETLDQSIKPNVKKSLRTQNVPTSSASEGADGWKILRLPFEKLTAINTKTDANSNEWSRRIRTGEGYELQEITEKDAIERVQVWAGSAGKIELAKISLVRPRNVSVHLQNAYEKNAVKLEIVGETSQPDAEVNLKLVDATGKSHLQTVKATDGKYTFTWENPPITLGKSNFLHASIGSGKQLIDQAVTREVFGFLPDTDHVWLKVKGRDIVTSAKSKGGEQPFYSVGVGYCKDVIVRGYDEEVAKYCKSMSLNTLRLAFYTTHFNNKPEMPLSFEDITAFIDPVLEAAKRHGLYVILDDHAYFKNEIEEETARGDQKSLGWTEERFQNWVARWVEVAKHYKDEPYILGYELCNEPVCDPETARKWYKKCIEAIREVDQRHIVIIGTHHWSHARAMDATWTGIANTVDDPYDNVVFSFHDYPMDDNPWTVQAHLKAFQDKYNVPVMCTEFGGGGKPERIHREFQVGMLSLFAFERIGWMIWSLSYAPELAEGFPTDAVKEGKEWKAIPATNPGYWIPFVDLWAPTARIMASPLPEPAWPDSSK